MKDEDKTKEQLINELVALRNQFTELEKSETQGKIAELENMERKQAEQIQSVLYNIADATNTTKDLKELFKSIKNYLSKIIDTTNFYIALYDKESNIITAPYYVDQLKKRTPLPQQLKNGLTAYVIRTAKPLYLTVEKREKLMKEGKIAQADWKSKIWIGVPLKIENKVIGAMAVQSYTDAFLYTEKDLEILEFVSNQIAVAIERKQAEKVLKESEAKYSALVESSKDGIIIIQDGVLKFINTASMDLVGYTTDEMMGVSFLKFASPEYRELVLKRYTDRIAGKEIPSIYEIELLRKDGSTLPVELNAIRIEYEGKLADLAFIRDITERKRAEQTHSVLHNIANAVNTTKDLNELFVSIKDYLGSIIDVTNFYIALYDKDQDWISFAYYVDIFVDEKVNIPVTRKLGKGLTEYVIRTDKSLLATEKVLEKLFNSGEVEMIGTPSKIWLGVPLKIENEVIGVVAVQSYTDAFLYTEKDLEILEFVSNQIAVAIERKQAQKELKESEERLSAIFESARDGIILVDKTGKIIKMNERITEVAGYTQENLVGKRLALMKMFTLKDLPRLMADFAKIIAGDEVTPVEYELKTKKGSKLYVEIHGSAVKENGKIVGAVALLRDITERKQAEERIKKDLKEKEVMLKEIYHRVKNNMQVIISLLNLQSRNIKDNNVKEMFNICKNRIFSMSLVHERLYSSKDLASIDFQPYIKSLTTHLLTSAGGIASNIQVDVNAKDITLDVNKAIPCGLIINELISNAFKYAFPSTADKPKARKGKVNVKMYKDKEGKYNLIIQDDGIGFPEDLDFRNTQSLGLQLVMGLTQQIDGNIDLEIDGGSKFKIVF